jgi:tRNA(His) guanylyltransferase
MNDALGDRMKLYEMAEAGRRFMPLLPIMARVDGRAFHSFTRGLKRPFDPAITEGMIETAKALAEDTSACMVYTQSDEISLAWHSTDIDSQVWFDGRICKMTSHLAALATLHFYRFVIERMSWYAFKKPSFDARCWQVPNRTEGANVFLWREWDATKNSLSMAASTYYSHTELHGRNGAEKHDMLHAKGINWNDYPASFKRGTYIQRRKLSTAFTAEEIEELPEKHHARQNPGLVIERSRIMVLEMPPLASVANREDVIFEGAEPKLTGTSSSCLWPTI